MSHVGTKPTCRYVRLESAMSTIADIDYTSRRRCRPTRLSQDLRAKRDSKLTYFTAWIASFVLAPCRKLPFLFPSGAPPRAPCIRQTRQPRTAGARHGFPVRFDLALQRGAPWALCMGLMLISFWYLS